MGSINASPNTGGFSRRRPGFPAPQGRGGLITRPSTGGISTVGSTGGSAAGSTSSPSGGTARPVRRTVLGSRVRQGLGG